MKKNILLPLTAALILLSGCNRGSDDLPDIHDNAPDRTEDVSESTDIPTVAPDTFIYTSDAETESSEAAPTGGYGSVSLVGDKYDYLRESVEYDGEFVQPEEMDCDYYLIPEETTAEFGYLHAADEELLYFVRVERDDWGEPLYTPQITEYNVETGETNSFEITSDTMFIYYIDRDYIVFTRQSSKGFSLLIRESGEIRTLPECEELYLHNGIYRSGKSLYYNIREEFSNADGTLSYDSSVLCRYAPGADYFAKLAADRDIIGATSEEIICRGSGGRIRRYGYSGEVSGFEYPYDYIKANGSYLGYIVPTTTENIFGQRFEVGRLLPEGITPYVQPIFVTYFGTDVYDIGITGSSTAFITICGSHYSDSTVLMADINGKRLTDLGYHRIQFCESEWAYLSGYDNGNILAVHTG